MRVYMGGSCDIEVLELARQVVDIWWGRMYSSRERVDEAAADQFSGIPQEYGGDLPVG